MDVYEQSLKLHADNKGKLAVKSKVGVNSLDDLSLAYTPGVAQACREIEKDKCMAYKYTIKSNTVAVVSDGSAVLGLGNIGPLASLPVMEGKALLFKEFADIDAFPICLDTDKIIETVKSISPVFGGINLEDIGAPRCFEIEDALQDLGIPVMHDDQHGTAVVVLGALINACKVVGKNMSDLTVVINGAGAAGAAVAKILNVKEIIICDSKGIIYEGREDLSLVPYKVELAKATNNENKQGQLIDALKGADVFVGVSVANALSKEMMAGMNANPIIFAMANPTPEILPEDAIQAGAAVVGTGRSDFPNQINNVLAFPGIFRGALDAGAKKITQEMKIAAAKALAECVESPSKEKILPAAFEEGVARKVGDAVKLVVKPEEKSECFLQQL
tara:strand:+ start:2535 stop:3701 length:1167 start_codon:yes stop_codon:yes gene_type:complete